MVIASTAPATNPPPICAALTEPVHQRENVLLWQAGPSSERLGDIETVGWAWSCSPACVDAADLPGRCRPVGGRSALTIRLRRAWTGGGRRGCSSISAFPAFARFRHTVDDRVPTLNGFSPGPVTPTAVNTRIVSRQPVPRCSAASNKCPAISRASFFRPPPAFSPASSCLLSARWSSQAFLVRISAQLALCKSMQKSRIVVHNYTLKLGASARMATILSRANLDPPTRRTRKRNLPGRNRLAGAGSRPIPDPTASAALGTGFAVQPAGIRLHDLQPVSTASPRPPAVSKSRCAAAADATSVELAPARALTGRSR